MPFRSEAQRKLFAVKVAENKMSQATFDEWNAATDQVKLPERVTPKKVASTMPKRRGRRR